MRHVTVASCTVVLVLIGCVDTGVRVPTGPDAVLSPDGLHRVEGNRSGTLFIRPNYAFGTYATFALGPTAVTFKQGSRVLEQDDVDDLKSRFREVARAAIGGTGRREVTTADRCVALVNLGLVDLDLLSPARV